MNAPFLFRAAKPELARNLDATRDHPVLEEELPATVRRDPRVATYLSGDTRLTEVNQETTDDS